MKTACLLALLVCIAFADKVYLKTGTVVDGDIIGKSDVIIKVYMEAFHRAVAIEKEAIDYIETSEGKRLSFDELRLKQDDYNPKFRVSPRRSRAPQIADDKKKLFDKDIFEQSHQENVDSAMNDSRRLNTFFNAPARWGSLGFGYTYMPGLTADAAHLRANGFVSAIGEFDLRCLNAEVRRNFNDGTGAIILDMGYGKKTFAGNPGNGVYEYASMRYVAVRYALCRNRWLLSPGLSGGIMLAKSGLTQNISNADTTMITDVSLDGHTFRPIIGLDLNFYDVISMQLNLDLWEIASGRYYAGLAFLMPFLQ